MRHLVVYVVIFLIAVCVIAYSVLSLREKRLSEFADMDLSMSENNFKATITTYKKIFASVYMNKINTDEVKYYMHSAYGEPENREKYSKMLRAYTDPIYSSLKNINLENIQFFFPDSQVFLGLNLLGKFGDDASPMRRTVINANEKDQYSEGFERGKYYTAYRYVFPLDTESDHVGSMEFVVGMDGLINSMNELYDNCYKYVVTKDSVSDGSRLPVQELTSGIYVDKCDSCETANNRENSYIINKILEKDLKSTIKSQFYKYEKFSYIAKHDNKHFVISFLPVTLTDGKGIGYVVSYHDADTIGKINRYYLTLAGFFIAIFMIVLIVIAILDYSRRAAGKNSEVLEKKVTEKIREIRERDMFFAQQGKMVALGEMLSGILHQWKQPVSSISMMADMVEFECLQNKCSSEETLKLISEIKEQTKFMAQTVTDFRGFLQPSEKPTVFNICSAVDELINLFEFSFARYNTSFSINWDHNACLIANVYGYPNEFKHIMLNLFNNARDAITESRERMISDNIDVSQFKGTITVSVTVENDIITVIVSDTGGGIPYAIIDKIFDQYFSTKKEKGTGIGLFMTKSLVENNMNGKISVRNNNQGAEFTLQFNAVQKEV